MLNNGLPEYFTVQEVADRLKVSKRHIWNLVTERKIECDRIGKNQGMIRFTNQQIMDYLAKK